MTYKLEIKKSAEKSLSKIPLYYQKKISRKVKSLVENPFPQECKKLKEFEGEPQYSMREGKYRIIYEVHKAEVLILVLRIGHRKDVYQ